MIPANLKFKTSPSANPEPIQETQQAVPTAQETVQSQNPTPPNNIDSQIISEDTFFNQYENDNKIAADAIIDEKTGEVSIDTSLSENSEKPPLSEGDAVKNTEILMRMRDGVQSFGLSLYVDGTVKQYEKYKYEDAQFDRLVQAWSPLVQSAGLKVHPLWDVAVAELMCTGPLLALAHTSRKQRIELDAARKRIKAQEEKINKLEKQSQTAFEKPNRSPDSQKKWAVDNAGNFTHSAAGVYLPKDNRNEKPNLATDYELLCKHNGKDFINKTFKIS